MLSIFDFSCKNINCLYNANHYQLQIKNAMEALSSSSELRHRWPDAHKQVPSVIASDLLFDKRDEVLITHQGEQYRLRRTRNGKLILTK